MVSAGQPVMRDAQAGSRASHVRGELVRRVGVALQIIPVGFAVAEQAMHHRASQRAVGAGPDQHRQVGLLHGRVHVDVDGDDLGAAFLAGARRVRHHIDLGVDRIGAPDHHAIGLRHFARIGAGELAGAGDEAGEGRIDADGGEEAGIFLGVAQAMDAVALHIAHGAGIVIRPHRFRAVARFGAGECFGDEIERVVPGDRRELRRSPWRRCGAAAAASGRDDAPARRNARPWRRSRRRYRRCRRRRGRGRWCAHRTPRPRARRSTGNRADRPKRRFCAGGRPGS